MTGKENGHKKGFPIILLSKVTDEIGDAKPHYVIEAGEEEGMRTQQDVRKWMEENDFVGTLYPVRFALHDEEARLPRGVARYAHTLMKFTETF